MISLPIAFDKVLPLKINTKQNQKLLTGFSIACAESLLLCPFERLTTLFMTEGINHRIGFFGFFRTNKGHILKELYRGNLSLFLR
jgi:hypothetical protein